MRLLRTAPTFLAVAAVLGLSLLSSGCPGGVDGEIDDESIPPILSAFFIQLDEVDNAFGVGATLATFPFGCDGATRRQEADNDAFKTREEDLKDTTDPDEIDDINKKYADTMVSYDQENTPTDFWSFSVGVNVEDDGDVGDKFDIEDDAGKIGFTACRNNDHPREADNAFRTDVDCFVADKGDVDVTEYEKGTTFKFTADVSLVEADDPDRDVGDVVVTGSASYCETLEDAIDDRAKIIEDLQD